MYLHLGRNVVVLDKTIIGVFDLDNASQSKITRKYLENAQKTGIVENIGTELPKSFVVCEDGGRHRLYIAEVASATIGRRSRLSGKRGSTEIQQTRNLFPEA